MAFPISGSIHFFGFLVFLFLGVRFLDVYRKEKNKIAKFFGLTLLFVGLSRLFISLSALPPTKGQSLLVIFELTERIFVLIGTVLLGYMIYFIKFPKHAKKIAAIFSLIALIVFLGFFLNPPKLSINESGVFTWTPPLIPSILNFLLILVIMVPGIILFFKEAKIAESKKARIRALGLGLAMLWIIIPGVLDFFFASLNPLYSEISYLIFYLILAVTLISTYFSYKTASE